jgi:hypothetical protein
MPTIPLLHFFNVLCVFRSSPFQCGFDFGGIRESLVGINPDNFVGGRGGFNSVNLVLPKTTLLVLHREISHCHAGGTSFLFPETEVLLVKFFEPNKTILPHNIPYSPSDLWNKFFVNGSLTVECDQLFFSF